MRYNKLKLGILLICLCVMGTVAFSACGSSRKSELSGTWIDDENENIRLIFNSDGTWSYDSSAPAHGTWQITEGSENEVQMPSESGLGQDMWHVGGVRNFSIDGETLTLDGVGTFTRQ